MRTAIELRGVWHAYPGSRRWALEGVDLEIREGRILAVVGPNGSGKTTMLKLAGTLYRPTRGTVRLWGSDFWASDGSQRLRLRRLVVYVHEKPVLVRGTALHNVAYGLLLRGYPSEEALERARSVMERMGVAGLASRERGQLSAGEAQLVSILRAVAAEPRVLLLDEPTAHLDLEKRRRLASLLRELRDRGMGVVVATHDYLLARRVADEAVVLEEGRIRVRGPPGRVLEV